jgi:hypothetical protein
MSERGARGLSRSRLAVFTVVVPLLVLALVEGGARLVEWAGGPVPKEAESPCFFQQVPLEPTMPEIGGYGRDLLAVDSAWVDSAGQVVEHPKPVDELRVVLLGGSAVGGWGLPRTAAFTGVLERALDRATPDRRVRVINLGRTGWGSPQVAWVFSQVARRLDPDLVVTVMGNNERMDVANALSLFEGAPETLFATRWMTRKLALARLLRPGRLEDMDIDSPPMPDLRELEDPEGIDRYALRRLHRAVRRIRRATRAPLLVSSVAVNHRYHPPGKEWWFAGDRTYNSEAWRTAHWAWYYGRPRLGIAAIRARLRERPEEVASEVLLGALLKRAGDPEADAVLVQAIDRLGPPDALDQEGRVLLTWATRDLRGAGAATELVRPWIVQLERDAPAGQPPCGTADLLWYAGARAEAAEVYEQCLLERMYYRADSTINEGLRRAAHRSGARFYDLEADVRAASPDGIPGFGIFYDYCHFNPRGSVLVGHLLAAQIVELLELPGEVPSATSALEAWDRERAGRLSDRPEVERWVGASYDVTLLTALRKDAPKQSRHGPMDSALTHTFDGNRAAASASFDQMHLVQSAFESYLQALRVAPAFAPARQNLRWLLETDEGAWELEHLSGDEPWMEQLRSFVASERGEPE